MEKRNRRGGTPEDPEAIALVLRQFDEGRNVREICEMPGCPYSKTKLYELRRRWQLAQEQTAS